MRPITRSRTRAAAQAAAPRAPAHGALPAQGPTSTTKTAAHAGRELPTELFMRVLELLSPNEQALSGRLACKDAVRHLNTPSHRTVRFGQPLQGHAADECWQQQMLEQGRHMNYQSKLRLLSTAAASGCEANVHLAWGVLQPCLFPEMVSDADTRRCPYGAIPDTDDPVTAAVKAGHIHIVAWLVSHGCPLDRERALDAAALYGSLGVLQAVWELLPDPCAAAPVDQVHAMPCLWAVLRDPHAAAAASQQMITMRGASTAARSHTPDACAKVCWLLDKYKGARVEMVLGEVLVTAAQGGRFDLVRHLHESRRAQPYYNAQSHQILQSALWHANLAAADWLVDEKWVDLPTNGAGDSAKWLWYAAAREGRADALRWLLDRGVPPQQHALAPAVRSGSLETVRFLIEECGLEEEPCVPHLAVGSGSMHLAAWLWRRRSLERSPTLYTAAAGCGSTAMVEWLLQVVGCPVDQDTALSVLCEWPVRRPVSSSNGGGDGGDCSGDKCDGGGRAGAANLLRVLQLLAAAGCRLEGLSTMALRAVAMHGNMDLAQWVVQQAEGGRWPAHAMQCILEDWPERGAPGSRLCDAVRVVLEAGGSPDSCMEVQRAVRRGDLEAVRLLHGQGRLRMGREVWAAAAESGCEAVLEWLAAEGCLRIGTDVGQNPYLAAGLRGDRGTLCALRRLGVPWAHSGVLRAAVDRRMAPPVVRWMVEEGAPWDGAAVAEAAEAARGLGGTRRRLCGWSSRWRPGGRSRRERLVARAGAARGGADSVTGRLDSAKSLRSVNGDAVSRCTGGKTCEAVNAGMPFSICRLACAWSSTDAFRGLDDCLHRWVTAAFAEAMNFHVLRLDAGDMVSIVVVAICT